MTTEAPTFSVVIETENLATAESGALSRTLEALEAQELSVRRANEVILVNSGRVGGHAVERLEARHPWLTAHSAPGADYYATKMLGARRATGEVVVFCDSDCAYARGWLRELLAPFRDDPEVEVVSGETATDETGLYGAAMRMTYIFPPFSGRKRLYSAPAYMMNNVAFRRRFLLEHPIPLELPVHRGNCLLHGRALQRAGTTLWMSPNARSVHPPPETPRHFVNRFVQLGRDAYRVQQIEGQLAGAPASSPAGLALSRARIFAGKLARALRRASSRRTEAPLTFHRALAASPLAAASLALYAVGLFSASSSPPSANPSPPSANPSSEPKRWA
jgi:hypothetical protein